MADDGIWIIGAGRIGLALGLLLHRAGAVSDLSFTGRDAAPPPHPLFESDPPLARYWGVPALPEPAPAAVVIAVPDHALPGVARTLVELGLPPAIPVLHTSGALGREVLEPLARRGTPTGSIHPLASVADPVSGAERLRGAWYAVEGDTAALEFARSVVSAAGGAALELEPGQKPLYHAAAAVASNFVVTLLAIAERLARDAGVPPDAARAALTELASGAVRNVREAGPAAALTGPVVRGDVQTVRAHLARLSGPDRAVYSVLARETLAIARARGLDPIAAEALERLLGGDE